jgi:hypothetical protein
MIRCLVLCLAMLMSIVAHDIKSDPPLCAGRDALSQPVIDFCHENNGTLRLRCCFTSDLSKVLAVDMLDLDLTIVPNFTQYANLLANVIDLRSNAKLSPSADTDFIALTTLDTLLLPEQFDCPGGAEVWTTIDRTTDPIGNRCQQQRDFCLKKTGVCVEPRSHCEVNGPNHFLCLCQGAYSGYKCLRHGDFPVPIFLGTTAGVTLIVSVFVYWTQRRHVRK